MKNRSFVLLSILYANYRLGEPEVRRTMLVKQAFLSELLRPLYRVWTQTFSFVRYLYGPYSDEIFQRLDTLVFSGLVEVVAFEQRGANVEARYCITRSGSRVMQKFDEFELVQLSIDLIWALQSLGVERVGTICKLVYREAEFSKLFAEHKEMAISARARCPLPVITAKGNDTFAEMAAIEQMSSTIKNADGQFLEDLQTRELVRMFLISLSRKVG